MRSRLSAGVRRCSLCAQKAVLVFAGYRDFRLVPLALQYGCRSAKFFMLVSVMLMYYLHKRLNRLALGSSGSNSARGIHCEHPPQVRLHVWLSLSGAYISTRTRPFIAVSQGLAVL